MKVSAPITSATIILEGKEELDFLIAYLGSSNEHDRETLRRNGMSTEETEEAIGFASELFTALYKIREGD